MFSKSVCIEFPALILSKYWCLISFFELSQGILSQIKVCQLRIIKVSTPGGLGVKYVSLDKEGQNKRHQYSQDQVRE